MIDARWLSFSRVKVVRFIGNCWRGKVVPRLLRDVIRVCRSWRSFVIFLIIIVLYVSNDGL